MWDIIEKRRLKAGQLAGDIDTMGSCSRYHDIFTNGSNEYHIYSGTDLTSVISLGKGFLFSTGKPYVYILYDVESNGLSLMSRTRSVGLLGVISLIEFWIGLFLILISLVSKCGFMGRIKNGHLAACL
jgi:hypothetical protein